MAYMKKNIYFVPGLAASSSIFEFLELPTDKYELHFLEWILPISEQETIESYSKRMAALVTSKNPILIGVSFGGVMVQCCEVHDVLRMPHRMDQELPKPRPRRVCDAP